ncbi:MAG: aminotransferase class III-fold pyridoxal phosphate-dependent enzyme, partial [Acidobacteriota bacterium]|nr:aminotransferase class III-fold pyridoxal phosphate-dependent enzyme [Acidobacteriota bacterium]
MAPVQSQRSTVEIEAQLTRMVRETAGLDSIRSDDNLLELGLDSLMLMQTRHQITEKFGVELPISDFFERLSTIGRIAADLANRADVTTTATNVAPPQVPVATAPVAPVACAITPPKPLKVEDAPPPPSPDVFVPYKRIQTERTASGDDRQRQHLESFIPRYGEKTSASKEVTDAHRPHFANNRNIAGFRPAWKEMIYQLVAESADGARIRTAGGREYIDFTMGFGVHLFGHNAPFIREAIAAELTSGFPLGPMYHLAGDVAELFCELTGNERVSFYNTGTEAVMVALRVARTVTQRPKIVLFEGSYHGSFDGVLALRRQEEGRLFSSPGSPGTTQGMVDDVIVLRYDDPQSLDVIRQHVDQIAAVLVEPVQSRRPDIRPRAFLHELRALTADAGIALIFDEVVTGFRIGVGGAQQFFGVKADLATYGKVVGGGMPIGLVAGKAEWMDAVDGGAWRYGDDSIPRKRNTFVAGTFCHHPLVLAAMRAVLQKLKSEGQSLQDELTRRTAALCARLDRFFETEEVPIRMATYGSLFRFMIKGDLDLLFFHLIDRGFYIWEGRNCFVSTAHTQADLDAFYDAVVDSVRELRAAGFIAPRTQTAIAATPAPEPEPAPRTLDFSLFFFSSADSIGDDDKYRLLLDGARYADANGYTAVWTPERHFHDFGGLYPNPAVTSAALAAITNNVRIRAGSTVLLLHDPVRFAENWSLVDNLSRGRVDLALALGWNSNDFALAPENFEERSRLFPQYLETVRSLWRGDAITRRGGKGEEVRVELHPRPVQRDLPVWYVASGNPETFRLAGEEGVNVLTYLEGQTVEQLAEKLAAYRAARRAGGHAGRGTVTLMLHTFVGRDADVVREQVYEPFCNYLRSSLGLWRDLARSMGQDVDAADFGEQDMRDLLARAFDRYFETSGLFGTPAACLHMV